MENNLKAFKSSVNSSSLLEAFLNSLSLGQKFLCHVGPLEGSPLVRQKLFEIGLYEGRSIEIVDKLDFGGPWIIEISGTRLALREEELRCLNLIVGSHL